MKPKLLLTAITLATLLFAAHQFTTNATEPTTSRLNGDTDCDGIVRPDDALDIFVALAGLHPSLEPGCPAVGVASPPGPLGVTRENPVLSGDSYVTPEGWEIEVTDFDADAYDRLFEENQFNEPPASGFNFSIIRLKITNVSAEQPDNLSNTDFTFAGSRNVGYTTFQDSCGVVPDRLESNDVFRGGTVEGNICFQTGQTEDGFALYTSLSFEEENVRWFSVE